MGNLNSKCKCWVKLNTDQTKYRSKTKSWMQFYTTNNMYKETKQCMK